jgi:hypothetical protein
MSKYPPGFDEAYDAEQLTAQLAQKDAALRVARADIEWWAAEHRCCDGGKAETVALINAALANSAPTDSLWVKRELLRRVLAAHDSRGRLSADDANEIDGLLSAADRREG